MNNFSVFHLFEQFFPWKWIFTMKKKFFHDFSTYFVDNFGTIMCFL